MFPARPLVKIDETIAMMNLSWKDIPSNKSCDVIRGTRILGLVRQLECLAKYSIDMFKDLSEMMNETTQKYNSVQGKVGVVAALIKSVKVDPEKFINRENIISPQENIGSGNQFNIKRTILSQAMIETADKILTFKKAKVTPIAKASMEVAIAKGIMTLGENSVLHVSSSSKASLIILIPIKANKIKAIQ